MSDLLRDSVVGQFLNFVSGGRVLPYADQRDDFVVPAHFRTDGISRSASRATIVGDTSPPDLKKVVSVEKSLSEFAAPTLTNADPEGGNPDLEKLRDELAIAKLHPEQVTEQDPNLVGWYGPDDQDNPRYASLPSGRLPGLIDPSRNWSLFKRSFVALSISLLTFSGWLSF